MRNNYYIIVVEEDEAVYRRIMSELKKLGCNHDVRRVSTQEELDDELTRLAPDFVICARSRSEWNPFAVLRQVRAFQASLPFAVIRGGLDGLDSAELLANGADACLDCDRLGELAPTLEEMLKRQDERQWLSVAQLRREYLPRGRRRSAARARQARAV